MFVHCHVKTSLHFFLKTVNANFGMESGLIKSATKLYFYIIYIFYGDNPSKIWGIRFLKTWFILTRVILVVKKSQSITSLTVED